MSDDERLPLGARIDAWCAGRAWTWRAGVLALLTWQAARVLRDPMRSSLFGGIDFGAHEFGHLFFSFGGEWLSIAGGSLMQLIVPVGAAVALAVTAEDWFGVSACGLWLAASLGDLAPYIADARAQELDLVSFSPDGGVHDWHYLLAHAGMLRQDLAIARGAKFLGAVIVVASVVFAISLLRRMATLPPPPPSGDAS